MDMIEVEVSRYEELLKMEYVYNLYRNKLKNDSYVPELERTLFEVYKNDDDDF